MRFVCRFIVLYFACFFGLAIAASAQEERFALLIGNSRYTDATPLRNPENDIRLVGASLSRVGFEVVGAENLSAEFMRQVLERFVEQVKAAENPVVLVYFAGHGVALNGQNYLLPVDVATASSEDVEASSITASEVLDTIGALDPKLQILILDACRNDPFENASRSLGRGLAEMSATGSGAADLGTLIAFSTSPGNIAQDGDSGSSPYASALAEALLVPGLSIEAMFKRVRRTVQERTKNAQEPWENAAMRGEFYFTEPEAAVDASLDQDFWELVSLVDSIESMRRYLERFPNGRFAELARLRIEHMNKDFAYRRKAETFPIVMLRDENFNVCQPFDAGFSPYEFRTRFQNRIVYLDVVLQLEAPGCDRLRHINRTWTEDIQELTQRDGQYRAGRDRWVDQIVREDKNWGHIINAEPIVIALPREEGQYSHWDPCEGTCIYYNGLVRVNEISGEESLDVRFEPIDPASIGLTWKFENTKQFVQSLGPNEVVIDNERQTLTRAN
jgi:uncharacterized caspase-like protein